MKKLLMLAVAALLAVSVSAQKGSMYLGLTGVGAFGDELGTGFSITDSETKFGIAPEFGYFLSDKLAIGIIAGIEGISIKDNDGDNPFAFKVNPYARYFLIQDGSFGFYLQGGVFFQSESPAKISTFGAAINPGVSYAISSSFTATATFGELGFKSISPDGGDSATEFGLNLKMSSLKFGLSYTF